jgi:UDP-N-acetylmuramoyl-L-alanyl-D-glutamate--2,6-diaminopimelate ligase
MMLHIPSAYDVVEFFENVSDITAICFDSRAVVPGSIFIAIKGENFDGNNFIDIAIEKGAKFIITELKEMKPQAGDVTYISSDKPRMVLALLASKFYGEQPSSIVGVTGTSGKTSTVGFYRQFCEFAGKKAASIGTLGVISNDLEFDSTGVMTSPDPVRLHQILADLKKESIEDVAIEVSSHGLGQHRLDGVNFKAAAFTNFTQDHLDYHKSMEAYLSAKKRFFKELLPSDGKAVLNCDIKEYEELVKVCSDKGIKAISYGMNEGADISFKVEDDIIKINAFGEHFEAPFNFAAEFQQYNVICALSLAVAMGMQVKQLVESIPLLSAAVGRLEKVADFNGAEILIDYAHKPDALEKVLISARKFTKNKLHVLFGCGGDRDQSKRKIMGEIATKLADNVIVTDDNPRSEDPNLIRKEILKGAPNAFEIAGRREAINYSIADLTPGDVLIVAGKGHEEYQIVGTVKYRFSDAEEIKKAIYNLSVLKRDAV